MAKQTKKDTELLKQAARLFGSVGGKARAKRLSRAERQKIARGAAQARWRKKPSK